MPLHLQLVFSRSHLKNNGFSLAPHLSVTSLQHPPTSQGDTMKFSIQSFSHGAAQGCFAHLAWREGYRFPIKPCHCRRWIWFLMLIRCFLFGVNSKNKQTISGHVCQKGVGNETNKNRGTFKWRCWCLGLSPLCLLALNVIHENEQINTYSSHSRWQEFAD